MIKPEYNSVSAPFVFLLSLCVAVSSGCSSDGEERPDYLDAQSVKRLEVPPKLTAPDTSRAIKLPQPSAKAMEQFNSVSAGVVSNEFSGLRLRTEQGLSYLEIDQPVDQIWASLPSFLANEGIEIAEVNQHLGYVDTVWLEQYEVSYGDAEGSSWFSRFSPDYKDKFRIRLTGNQQQTHMYISHRGMQIAVLEEGTAWQQRQSEAMLEREILYRYLLYTGAGKSQATGLLANYKPYQSRASIEDNNTDEIRVLGDRDHVWLRLQQAMDRLGVEIISSDKQQSMMVARVGNIRVDQKKLEKGNWFSRLFGGNIDLDDDEGYEGRTFQAPQVEEKDFMNFRLTQQADDHSSVIKLKHENGAPVKDGPGFDFRNALYLQLK